ncbi:MAG: DUF72 domain-containing protein [Candidatus Krumholzibacteriota bacterium]|nr:DUF72 domain-containing protein [Candidatus Krumholzibacteriota bacterium]
MEKVNTLSRPPAVLYVGPAGWSYPDWIGPVYPRTGMIDRLLYIARFFNCVELNSSFYRTPSEKLTASWARRLASRTGFKLTVKVLQRFTHQRICPEAEVKRFIHSFDPLWEKDLVGAFLLQFPWSFRNQPENRELIRNLGAFFQDFPTAVELRHGSWEEDATLCLLGDCGLSLCNIDQPRIGDSVGPSQHLTNREMGYIRLHGRNKKNWFNQDAGRDARYDYLYNRDEITEWEQRARMLLSSAKNLFIITNNHFRGQALVNALQLKARLLNRPQEIPPQLLQAYPVLKEITVTDPFELDLE